MNVRMLLLAAAIAMLQGCNYRANDPYCAMCSVSRLDYTCYGSEKPPIKEQAVLESVVPRAKKLPDR